MKGYGNSSLCKGGLKVGLWVEVVVGNCGSGWVQDFSEVSGRDPVNPAKQILICAVEAL